ncbi:MAG: hypothetical protein NW224_12425 [Leptolyngbyaceae cyanobacterium bins.302]|nr:hypothetical protein [Leptolyngbyaceae cyanobacterium bins.302]
MRPLGLSNSLGQFNPLGQVVQFLKPLPPLGQFTPSPEQSSPSLTAHLSLGQLLEADALERFELYQEIDSTFLHQPSGETSTVSAKFLDPWSVNSQTNLNSPPNTTPVQIFETLAPLVQHQSLAPRQPLVETSNFQISQFIDSTSELTENTFFDASQITGQVTSTPRQIQSEVQDQIQAQLSLPETVQARVEDASATQPASGEVPLEDSQYLDVVSPQLQLAAHPQVTEEVVSEALETASPPILGETSSAQLISRTEEWATGFAEQSPQTSSLDEPELTQTGSPSPIQLQVNLTSDINALDEGVPPTASAVSEEVEPIQQDASLVIQRELQTENLLETPAIATDETRSSISPTNINVIDTGLLLEPTQQSPELTNASGEPTIPLKGELQAEPDLIDLQPQQIISPQLEFLNSPIQRQVEVESEQVEAIAPVSELDSSETSVDTINDLGDVEIFTVQPSLEPLPEIQEQAQESSPTTEFTDSLISEELISVDSESTFTEREPPSLTSLSTESELQLELEAVPGKPTEENFKPFQASGINENVDEIITPDASPAKVAQILPSVSNQNGEGNEPAPIYDHLAFPALVHNYPLGQVQPLTETTSPLLSQFTEFLAEDVEASQVSDAQAKEPVEAEKPVGIVNSPSVIRLSPSTDANSTLIGEAPTDWSSFEDLLKQSEVTPTVTESWETQFSTQSLSTQSPSVEELVSPWASESSNVISEHGDDQEYTLISPLLNSEVTTSQSLTHVEAENAIDEEAFEFLAQMVYRQVRDRFVLDRERCSHTVSAQSLWIDVANCWQFNLSSSTTTNGADSDRGPPLVTHPVERPLEVLTRTVYKFIQFRLEAVREKHGTYKRRL